MQSLIASNAAQMTRSGIRKIAIVLPENIFALAAVSKIHGETSVAGIEAALFSSETDGVKWLLT